MRCCEDEKRMKKSIESDSLIMYMWLLSALISAAALPSTSPDQTSCLSST